MRWILVLVIAFLAAIGAYYVVAIVSCKWLWPQSNLCGIYGPVGSFVAFLLALWTYQQRRKV
jgi:hypothetical protein